MQLSRTTAGAVTLTFAGLLALAAACGGQPGRPAAGSSPWHWPNDVTAPGRVTHTETVPPVPGLVQISAGDHPAAAGERAFNRMSFTFFTAFPSYRFEFVGQPVSDPGGKVIPIGGQGVLRIVFTQAQAHTAGGAGSSVISQPAPRIGYQRMTGYAQGGDFEGVLTHGIGITRPVPYSNPQFAVRAYEVETAAPQRPAPLHRRDRHRRRQPRAGA